VLEIGCGPGLVATCVCRSGAGRVLLTDGDPQTLVNCLSNLRMNGQGGGTLLGSWQEAAGFVQNTAAAAAAAAVAGSTCQQAQVGESRQRRARCKVCVAWALVAAWQMSAGMPRQQQAECR
jgi:predicted nicotinamide N-methyase